MKNSIKNKIAKLIKRDTGINVNPETIRGINRGYWRTYPEAFRWLCKESDGLEREIYCSYPMKFCIFLGGFEKELHEETGGELEFLVENKNQRSRDKLVNFFRHGKTK